MPRTLTWLHLSDLHFSKKRHGYDQAPMLRALQADISGVARKMRLTPDLIVFTGDLAFGELTSDAERESIDEQFDGAFEIIESIRTSFRKAVPKDRIFIVPGNHDVKRSLVGADQVDWLSSASASIEKITRHIRSCDVTWERYIARLKAFADALERHGYDHLLMDSKRLISTTTFNANGMSVGIAGLNSAWSSSRDGEKGRLWMAGQWQMQETHERVHNADVRFVLSHHPFNWLVEAESDAKLWQFAERQFHFMLHGHEHDEWVSFRDEHARIAAAATHDGSQHINGYNFCRFDVDRRSFDAWLRRYEEKSGKWAAHIIPDRTDDHGHLAKQMLRRGNASRRRPVKSKSRPTAFLAVPMAAVGTKEYMELRGTALRMLGVMRDEWKIKVYYAGEKLRAPDEFEPADRSWRRNLVGLERCKIFIMVFPTAVVSSVLVEAGMALARNTPSLYYVRKGVTLPFMLKAAAGVYPNVAIRSYSSDRDLVRELRGDGWDTCKALIGGNKARQK